MARHLHHARRHPENVKKEADWLYPTFSDEKGKLRMSIHALVIESQGKRIIVDTCIGNEKVRSNPAWSNLKLPFLSDLEKAGHTRATRSIASSARICTSTTSDGTRCSRTASGCRRFPTRAT